VSSQIASLIRDAGLSFEHAVKEVVLSRLPKNSGGVVAVNSDYELLMPYNTGGMIRGSVDESGVTSIGIHEELITGRVGVSKSKQIM
jgi:isoaspartyl peptidase/L-asparaginase-like protein (Ntn-hydrolase superfamily)